MKAYKGFYRCEDGTLWCRGFQYVPGQTYKFDGEPVICEQGFHACHEPWQCWLFYPNNGKNVYYEVECGGKIVESNNGDGKFVCTEIQLIREIPAPENIFNWCGCFHNGYGIVKLKSKKFALIQTFKWNFINTEGKLLSGQWFDCCRMFYNGYAKVGLNGKDNFINTEGKLLSDQWFDKCGDFRYGHAEVILNGKCYKIDKNGKITE